MSRARSGTGSEVVGTPAAGAFAGMGLVGFTPLLNAAVAATSGGGGGGGNGIGNGGGVGTMDGLGLGLGGMGGEEEAERMRRSELVVGLLGRRWGFVSPEGVERVARRVGLEFVWMEGERGGRTLSIAGNGVLVEVEFGGDRVVGVTLSFPEAKEGGAEGSAGVGAEVLRRDLLGRGEEEGAHFVGLEAFAGNLGRLARMAQLGGEGVSCFDAVEGVLGALGRVWEWEVGRGVAEGKSREVVEREVLCGGLGRPRMHGRGRVGLRVEYWMERRLVPTRENEGKEKEMDIGEAGHEEGDERIWSLLIDCEAFPASQYPSIRVSNSWVSETIEKPMPMDESLFTVDSSTIDWQDPPPTFTSSASGTDADTMNIDSSLLSDNLPNVRFIAHLEPPVTVPLQTAIEIFNTVGSPLAQESYQTTTYMSLLIPSSSRHQQQSPSKSHFQDEAFTFKRVFDSFNEDGSSISHRHNYNFSIHQASWARTITDIPFSHPRQLIMILPVLRQWALLSSIIKRTLAVDSPSENPTSTSVQPLGQETMGVGTATKSSTQIRRPQKTSRTKSKSKPKFGKHARPPTPSDTDSDSDTHRIYDTTPPTSKPASQNPSIEDKTNGTTKQTHTIDLSLDFTSSPRADLLISIPPNLSNPGHSKREDSTVRFQITPGPDISALWAKAEDVRIMELTDTEALEKEERESKALRILGVSEDLGIVGEWMGKYRR